MKPPSPADETARLEALRQYDILDTAPEQEFDDLAHLAAQICGTPISAITLVDEERQWFKARVGLAATETPRAVSFCAHAVVEPGLLIVPDASADERFADNPLVTTEPHIRFYAGVPLVTPEGQAIGTLCVIDTVPRQLDPTQQEALRRLGRHTVALLEARPETRTEKRPSRLSRQQAERQRVALAAETTRQDADNLQASEVRYRRLFEAAKDGILILNAASGKIEDVNPYLCELLGYAPNDFLGKQLWKIGAFHNIAANQDAFRVLQAQAYIRYDDLPLETKDGHKISVEFVSNVYTSGEQEVIQCNIRDISAHKWAAAVEQESQRFLQSTLDALAAHIAVLDEHGIIIAVNQAWRQFAAENEGTAASCGVGANYIEVCDKARGAWAEEAPAIAGSIREVMAGQHQAFCLEYPCHSPREERWFNVCVTRFIGDGPLRVVVAHENISARKQAEDLIRISEANLAVAQQMTHLGSWELDLLNLAAPNDNPLHWSDEVFRIFGYAPRQIEVSSENFFRAVHPDDRERIRAVLTQAVIEGKTYRTDHRILLPDGTERIVHEQSEIVFDERTGKPLKMVGTVQDITERKQSEEALSLSQKRFEILSRATNDAVWDWNLLTDDLWWNEGFQTLFGYDRAAIEPGSESWQRRLHPADAARVSNGIHAAIESGQQSWSDEYRFRRADGSYAAIFDRGFIIHDEHHQPIRMVGSMQDITERKQAEQTLQQERDFITTVIDTVGSLVIVLDSQGHIIRFNRACEQLTGYSFEEVRNKYFMDLLLAPEEAEEVKSAFQEICSGHFPSTHENYWVAKDGSRYLITWDNTALLDTIGAVEHIIGAGLDITGRKRAEAAQSRLVAILEATPDFVGIADAAGQPVYLNRAGRKMMGMAENMDVSTTSITTYVAPGAKTSHDEGTMVARRDGAWRGETALMSCDGREIPVSQVILAHKSPAGEVEYLSTIARDISDRKQAEAALQKTHDELELRVQERTTELAKVNEDLRIENIQHQMTMGALRLAAEALQEAKAATDKANEELRAEIAERERAVEAQQSSYVLLSAVTEGTTDCIFVKDLAGRYLMINSAGALRRRKTVAEILGKTDYELFSPETAHILIEADRRILAADTTQTFEETTLEDGVTRTHLVTKGPHRNPRGEVIGIIGMARDITARKQQEESLRLAKEEADIANAAKSEFLSRMSHELRTPLNAILGFGQILNKQDLTPLAKESVSYILHGGRHLLDLINEVLDIARVEAGRLELSLEPIDLADIAHEACDLVRPLADERHIRLNENTAPIGRYYILADRQRLKQALINLLSNAIKYNREGGQVEVSCAQKPDGRMAIAVRDTGPGIAPQDLPKLFTPFERLNAASSGIEGTGLGLVFSQRLVTAMGGTLSVTSILGQGTTFTIELPQATPPEHTLTNVSVATPPLATSQAVERTYKVLCIEDNPSNLRLMEAILEGRPEITLLTAMQGSIGLDLARQHEPNLILLDLNLPDMHGKDVLARLQQSAITSAIPVVVISADATPNQIERLLTAGAKDYLTKPLNVSQFLRTMDEFLRAADE